MEKFDVSRPIQGIFGDSLYKVVLDKGTKSEMSTVFAMAYPLRFMGELIQKSLNLRVDKVEVFEKNKDQGQYSSHALSVSLSCDRLEFSPMDFDLTLKGIHPSLRVQAQSDFPQAFDFSVDIGVFQSNLSALSGEKSLTDIYAGDGVVVQYNPVKIHFSGMSEIEIARYAALRAKWMEIEACVIYDYPTEFLQSEKERISIEVHKLYLSMIKERIVK